MAAHVMRCIHDDCGMDAESEAPAKAEAVAA
jgi:hypothetical protein